MAGDQRTSHRQVKRAGGKHGTGISNIFKFYPKQLFDTESQYRKFLTASHSDDFGTSQPPMLLNPSIF